METRILVEYEVLEASVAAKSIFDMSARDGIHNSQLITVAEEYMEQKNLLEMVREGKLHLWGTFEKGQMIAVSGLQSEGHITLLYVLPYYQRLGVGRNLMNQMLDYAKNQLHLNRVTVNVMPISVTGYFSRMGFTRMNAADSSTKQFVSMYLLLTDDVKNDLEERRPVSEKNLILALVGGLVLLFVVALLLVIFGV